MLSGCAAAITPDGEIASMEKSETAAATCFYLRTQQASCEELKRSYDEGFRAGKEIVATEFRTRSELNQPYVWQPPMISEVDMPARVVETGIAAIEVLSLRSETSRTIREKVHPLAEDLPPVASWDDVIEEVRFRRAVETGIAAADSDSFATDEEIRNTLPDGAWAVECQTQNNRAQNVFEPDLQSLPSPSLH